MAVHRYLCSQLVTLRWDGGETVANLEEIHARGGVVESDTEIGVGAGVRIGCADVCFTAQITKAEEHPFGWRLEVEFPPEAPWSIERFRPEHLFDPATMLEEAT